jgi:hypothetical protein
MDSELETYALGGVTPETREYYGKLKSRAILQLRGVQGLEKSYEKEVEAIDEILMAVHKPQRFDGSEGREVQLIKQFERTCGLLTKHMGVQSPEKLTVRKFYMRLADLKEQFKEQQPKQRLNGKRRQGAYK